MKHNCFTIEDLDRHQKAPGCCRSCHQDTSLIKLKKGDDSASVCCFKATWLISNLGWEYA